MAVALTPVEQLNELIRGFKFALFSTVHSNGSVHTCPMVTQAADADGHLWFFTDTDTDKVDAIRENDNVGVAYADPARQRYVSVSGRAQLLNTPEKKRELWSPEYTQWFPQGLDDRKLVLIRVMIIAAEYWDGSAGGMVRLPGFAQATFTGEQYHAAGHREMDFPQNRRDQNP